MILTMTRKPMPTAWLILMNSRLSAALNVSIPEIRVMNADQHTLGATANKLSAFPDKVLGNIGKFLESLGHFYELESKRKRTGWCKKGCQGVNENRWF